jgi:hypothetical protein
MAGRRRCAPNFRFVVRNGTRCVGRKHNWPTAAGLCFGLQLTTAYLVCSGWESFPICMDRASDQL